MTPPSLVTRPAGPRDRALVRALLESARWKHQHLDWIDPLDLLRQGSFFIADAGGTPAACVSVPDDPLGVAWIRLLAVDAPHPPQAAWEALWPAAEASAAQVSSRAAALPQEGWVGPLLESCGFHLATEVLFLEARAGEQAGHDVAGLVMADMAPTDLEEVVRVDCLAFSEIWRHSLATLAVAQGKSAVARVASLDRRTVGYAISTASPYAGHLARLAVDPAWQGKGIGTALIADTLTLMARRGADRVTVNTQADNLRSQDLYRRMGFRETGPRFPVFEKSLAAAGRAPMP